ncbi:heterokaryon incompatibility protein-domain-containing protein [Podospora conica]|nr:heterokaryon incompatibility protein-domain-containing protein [Schizothecium conicum]
MRLLNTSTLELDEFVGNDIPPYAILSHTWGDKEATFQDAPNFPRLRALRANLRASSAQPQASLDDDHGDHKLLTPGTSKILDFCDLAQSDGHEWAWADTCCIDKSSSAELSEAINSMYRWYAEATCCYVYLSDVKSGHAYSDDVKPGYFYLDDVKSGRYVSPEYLKFSLAQLGLLSHNDLEWSRWFTRGWCLQELIAPRFLEFYDVDWKALGTKLSLCSRIIARTGIPESVLLEPWCMDFQEFPAAARFSWASDRTTTRDEDMAYSLMGLLDVNMPLLYGEGGQKAFYRLQQEFLAQTEDLSLLLWTWNRDQARSDAILARQPACFGRVQPLVDFNPSTGEFSYDNTQTFKWANIVSEPHEGDPLAITSRGLRVKLLATRADLRSWPGWIAYTSCSVVGADALPDRKACIQLYSIEPSPHTDTINGSPPTVIRGNPMHVVGVPDLDQFEWKEFYLDFRREKKELPAGVHSLPWPARDGFTPQNHFRLPEFSLELVLEVPESANVCVSMLPRGLGQVTGSSRHKLSLQGVSCPAVDGSCLTLQFGALILDIPGTAPAGCTPISESIAVTFGLTGAGPRFETLRAGESVYETLVWCDIVKILPECRPSGAIEKHIRDLRGRALYAVLPEPKDKCRYNLGSGKVLWAFVKRGNPRSMDEETMCFHWTVYVVLEDGDSTASQPLWLSSQLNASVFAEAPRDWRLAKKLP